MQLDPPTSACDEQRQGPDIPIAPQRALRPGLVTLAGAGPGDPGLLTLAAHDAILAAQTVLYDHLVGDAVLALLPASAQRIYVGKKARDHAASQCRIIELLLQHALAGQPVLRLKGGDPYIFGRGGEETQALAAAGIPFRVIPGISAAQGASAYAGIPLTHREHAQMVVYATGHCQDGSGELDWDALARPRQTVVIYMGVGALARICEQLARHGLPADTPAALVENATAANQRVVRGVLRTLPRLALEHAVRAPALIVIGSVVALQPQLAWFGPAALVAEPLPTAMVATAALADG